MISLRRKKEIRYKANCNVGLRLRSSNFHSLEIHLPWALGFHCKHGSLLSGEKWELKKKNITQTVMHQKHYLFNVPLRH